MHTFQCNDWFVCLGLIPLAGFALGVYAMAGFMIWCEKRRTGTNMQSVSSCWDIRNPQNGDRLIGVCNGVPVWIHYAEVPGNSEGTV